MMIDSISFEESEEVISGLNRFSSSWCGREVELFEKNANNLTPFANRALSCNWLTGISKPIHINPMGGSANAGVHKDSEGNTTVEVEVEHTSDDGSVGVKVTGSVDQDGNVEGRVDVGISWDN